MTRKELAEKLLAEGNGVLRLTPTWVPRSFCRPGKRIKLHPDDYYVLGLERGGIGQRRPRRIGGNGLPAPGASAGVRRTD